MNLLFSWIIKALAIFGVTYLLSGVHIDGFLDALLLAAVLSLINTIVKPILVVLTIPITVITLGLFLVVINALMVLLADSLLSGFSVDGFWWAVIFSIAVSIVTSVLEGINTK